MGGLISFGKYDSKYKYILFYVISQLLDQILFQKDFIEKIDGFDKKLISDHKLIQEMCNYIGIAVFSTILLLYENYLKKSRIDNETDSLSDKSDKLYYSKRLIYNNILKSNISQIKIILIIFMIFLARQLLVTFYKVGLAGLDFWMFEIYFIYIVSSKIMGYPAYKHQKLSVYIVVILCTIMKTITFIMIYIDSSKRIYKTYPIFIPIGLIVFLFLTYLRAHASCKIKALMDLKYISSNKLLIIYGLMGTIICCLVCIMTTFLPCGDSVISFDEMIKICKYNRTINDGEYNENVIYYYYDSFISHSENLFNKSGLDLFKNICLIIMKIIVIYLVNLLSILIIKYLNPLFFVVARFIYYFLVEFMNAIISLSKKESLEEGDYLDFFSELFAIFGILVYTELIELNFCDLNFNLKKNIILRSKEDVPNIPEFNINKTYEINYDDDSSVCTEGIEIDEIK